MHLKVQNVWISAPDIEPGIFVKEEVFHFDDDLQFDDAQSEEDDSTKSAAQDFQSPDFEEESAEEKTDKQRKKKSNVVKKTNELKRKRKSSAKKAKDPESDYSDDDSDDDEDPDFDLVKRPKKKETKIKTENEKVGGDRETKKKRTKSLFSFPTEGDRDLSKKFQCPNCIKGYSNKRDFQLHLMRHEPDAKGWKCQRCKDVAFKIRSLFTF